MPGFLNVVKAAEAGGITGVALSVVCAILVFSVPQAAIGLFSSMIHTTIPMTPVAFDAGRFVVGLVVAAVTGALIGGVFAWAYNRLTA